MSTALTPQRLPPLHALRVFHAVVRHRSFRGAAEELRVTPQAVSQQIKLLEDTLGQELFDRRGRTIAPHENAILLSHFVQSAFDELAEGVRRISKTGHSNRINVNASPYFATRHLLDRIARFREIMPNADLRLTTMVDLPDFVSDEVDVAIQWGFGSWKNCESKLLLRDMKEICCAPALAQRITSPGDLAALPLLHPVLSDSLWNHVLRHMGVERSPAAGDMRFQDAATMRRATTAGLGVGLLSAIDAEEELKSGTLMAPLGRGVMASMAPDQIPAFYLVLPKAHRRVKAIATFCDWVEREDWAAA
jgi:LysR family glycine cleavage system transcriptional activator